MFAALHAYFRPTPPRPQRKISPTVPRNLDVPAQANAAAKPQVRTHSVDQLPPYLLYFAANPQYTPYQRKSERAAPAGAPRPLRKAASYRRHNGSWVMRGSRPARPAKPEPVRTPMDAALDAARYLEKCFPAEAAAASRKLQRAKLQRYDTYIAMREAQMNGETVTSREARKQAARERKEYESTTQYAQEQMERRAARLKAEKRRFEEARCAREERARERQRERERRDREIANEEERHRKSRQPQPSTPPPTPAKPVLDELATVRLYEHKWTLLKSAQLPDGQICTGEDFPWPIMVVDPATLRETLEKLTSESVAAFFFHPAFDTVSPGTRRERVRAEMLRWHPDKFAARIAPKITPEHRERVQMYAAKVAALMTGLLESV